MLIFFSLFLRFYIYNTVKSAQITTLHPYKREAPTIAACSRGSVNQPKPRWLSLQLFCFAFFSYENSNCFPDFSDTSNWATLKDKPVFNWCTHHSAVWFHVKRVRNQKVFRCKLVRTKARSWVWQGARVRACPAAKAVAVGPTLGYVLQVKWMRVSVWGESLPPWSLCGGR